MNHLSVNFEKLYFAYILTKPEYMKRVEPYFFRSNEIQFVYTVIKQEYFMNTSDGIPKIKRIVELVKLKDTNKTVSKEVLKAILTVNLDEYSPDGKDDSKHAWLDKRVQAWITFNNVQSGLAEAVDYIRNVDNLDFDNIREVAGKIKLIINNNTNTTFSDSTDLGSSFDDIETHIQDDATEKVDTGWDCMNHILNGGWDIKTLNFLAGMSNSGKSLIMQNIGINAANEGKNVIYFTLEMSEKKVMKRMGAMRLKIPINEYETVSKNRDHMQEKMTKLKQSITSKSNAFNKSLGKIYVKEFPAGQATVSDFQNYCERWEEKFDEKIDMIIVDYISIMAPEPGLGYESNLYLKGKHLAEGLRALGFKYECPVITGIQIGKDAWGTNDMALKDVSESKAFVETADTFWGIIRSPEMKRMNLYKLKAMKLRDGNFEKDEVMFDMHPQYLSIENDRFTGED